MQLSLLSDNTEHRFRELYYHLYSNSNASRSERIFADLSKLILTSIAQSKGNLRSEVSLFMNGNGTANSILLPKLIKLFPNSLGPEDKFILDEAALRHALKVLTEIDLVASPSHTFGDAFQALMGPRLRGDKGQFFTPRSVVRAIVEILSPEPDAAVIDPACGTGGFLSAVIDKRKCRGAQIIGIEKDRDLALLSSALASVHDESVVIHNTNSLLLSDLALHGVKFGTFDCVLTNPPFGAKIGITEKATLSQFALGHVWDRAKKSWTQTGIIRASQDPQILFLELCIRLLKDGGRMAIVLPEGIFGNSGAGYIWDFVRSQGHIEALIDCPRTTFQPGTDTKTNILFFRRGEKSAQTRRCWIAVAYSCGHDRRGRSVKTDGKLVPDDFAAIAQDWHKSERSRTLWSRAELKDPYYLVPRYYDDHLADEVKIDADKLSTSVTTLGEMINLGLLTIRKGHEVGSDAYGSGDIPFVRTSDLHNFEIAHDPTNCVSEEVYEQYQHQQRLKPGDVLMVVDGRYKIGRCAILHDWTTKCVVQSHLRIISLTSKAKFSPFALLYALSLPSVQREIRRLVFIQSTLGGLGSRIREIRLPDPRSSLKWGETLKRFSEAISERARQSAYLQDFGNEVEL